MSRLSPARRFAYEVSNAAREREAFASDIFDTRVHHAHLNESDRAFARMLIRGVAATWGTLDEVIDHALAHPSDISPTVRDALRISAYELIFLQKDSYAAVDQGVELVASVAPRARRLANAVLRKIVRLSASFPFGDVETDDEALMRYYAFPSSIGRMLIAEMGRTKAAEFMRISNTPAPVYVAANSIKQADVRAERDLATYKAVSVSLPNYHKDDDPSKRSSYRIPGCFRLSEAHQVSTKSLRTSIQQGKYLVSDASAQAIASLAIPEQYPERFLEIGAGRGTKTVLIQSQMYRRFQKQTELHSVDCHDFKADILLRRAKAYGLEHVVPHVVDATHLSSVCPDRLFDAILVDAPCSGLGTLRRHPEIRWRLTQEHISELSTLGLALLREAASRLKVHGELTYATCTVLSQENEQVIRSFLSSAEGKNFRILSTLIGGASPLFVKTSLTEHGCDAHFAARLIRIA